MGASSCKTSATGGGNKKDNVKQEKQDPKGVLKKNGVPKRTKQQNQIVREETNFELH